MNDSKKKVVKVCQGQACCNNFADSLFKEVQKKHKDNSAVSVERCGCQAKCGQGPVVVIETISDGAEELLRKTHTEMNKNDLDALL